MEDKIFSPLEVARIIGQPLDPRKPYPQIVEAVCETDTAEPEDYLYYFDVLVETEKVYVITATGAVTQEYVTLDTPAQLQFVDLASPEYYIKLTDYASRKEDAIARKKRTINWALNSYESWRVIQLLDAASTLSSHTNTIESGYSRFNFAELISMVEDVQDYGDNYVLIAGAKIDKDILLWDWNDDKNQSMLAAWDRLNIEKIRMSLAGSAQTFGYHTGTSGDVLETTKILPIRVAYLVARDNAGGLGKPLLFVRKKLDSVKNLGGVMSEDGSMPQRLVFVSPNPITVTGTARYLAIGLTGYEQIASAVTNPYAVKKFTRT